MNRPPLGPETPLEDPKFFLDGVNLPADIPAVARAAAALRQASPATTAPTPTTVPAGR